MKIGSLFSGYGGLDLAVEEVFGAKTAWHVEFDKHPSKILAERFPGVPNYGDVSEVDWGAVEPVDILTGGFPCFTAGHTVLTKRGIVPIEDVVVGDDVLTHRNRWRKVTATMSRQANVVSMTGFGHTAITTTPNHPFYTPEGEWVAAKEMTGRFWGTPTSIPAVEAPKELRDSKAAFLMGLYLGDGHVGTSNGKRRILLSMADHKAVEVLPDLHERWGACAVKHGEKVTRIHITRTGLAALAQSEFGHLAHNKTIPTWVFGMSREWRDALLAGLRFTDGSEYGSGWRLTTVSRRLAIGVRLLVAMDSALTHSTHFTPRPSTTVIEGRTVNQKDSWTVVIRQPSRRWEEINDGLYRWRRVRAVEDAGREEVFDITVDEDHSFVCDGFVVHNCQDLSHAGRRAGLRPGTRSGLWEHMAFAISELRPKIVVIENVRGLLSAWAHSDVELCEFCMGNEPAGVLRALGAVLGDLADIGYDAQWCGVRAADAGAPHGRFRVFIVAYPSDPGGRQFTRTAAARNGLPVPAERRDEPVELFSAPTASDRFGAGRPAGRDGGDDLRTQISLLPTPTAQAARHGETPDVHANGFGSNLWDLPHLLPTPTPFTNSNNETPEEWLERRADVVKRTGTHHGLPLAVAAASITDGNPILQSDPMASLEDACSTPVPSAETTKEPRTAPTASDQTQLESPQSLPKALEGQQAITSGSQSGSSQGALSEQLLPTPRATDGTKGGPNQRGSSGDLMLPSAVQLLPTLTSRDHKGRNQRNEPDCLPVAVTNFGPYAAAVARWEAIIGRPAPSPTEPSSNGKPRLSPAFVEWMMGLPAGWVTDVDTPRNAQLKALGNGVVPQQAALALRLMLGGGE